MKCGFHHLHVICRDLEGMIAFFVENFDAQMIAYRKFDGADGAKMSLGGIGLNLRMPGENEQVASNPGVYQGFHHIGLQVDDVNQAYEDLKAKGFEFSMAPTREDNLIKAFFRGPENMTLELMQFLP